MLRKVTVGMCQALGEEYSLVLRFRLELGLCLIHCGRLHEAEVELRRRLGYHKQQVSWYETTFHIHEVYGGFCIK